MAKRHRKGNKRDGIHQERDGEDGHGQTTMTFLGRWPMLPASKGIKKYKVNKIGYVDYMAVTNLCYCISASVFEL